MKKNTLLIIGWFFVGLGVLGAFLPVLPTTPFLLVAAGCFAKSSPKLYQRLVSHERFGPPLKDWLDNKIIRRKAKWLASAMITLGISSSLYFFTQPAWLNLTLIAIGVGAIAFIAIQRDEHSQ